MHMLDLRLKPSRISDTGIIFTKDKPLRKWIIKTKNASVLLSVATRDFLNPKPVFWLFFTPKPVCFNYQTRVFKKHWNCCCIQMLVSLITLKLQISACNGQIGTLEPSTIIMSHEVLVFLDDYRRPVVGPFIFSFRWPI